MTAAAAAAAEELRLQREMTTALRRAAAADRRRQAAERVAAASAGATAGASPTKEVATVAERRERWAAQHVQISQLELRADQTLDSVLARAKGWREREAVERERRRGEAEAARAGHLAALARIESERGPREEQRERSWRQKQECTEEVRGIPRVQLTRKRAPKLTGAPRTGGFHRRSAQGWCTARTSRCAPSVPSSRRRSR
jgi:hypothetical protein